jgi:hypothetical protein
MQALTGRSWPRLTRTVLILLIALTIQSCGWEKTIRFSSPSGRESLEIWQTRLDNSWGFRIVLVSDGKWTTLFESRRDAVMYFFHVYWSPDEARVAVVATGFNIWHLAWDTRSKKPVPFEEIRNAVGKSIKDLYHVPLGEDPIQWSALNEAQAAFVKIHPEIHLTYH